MRITTAERPVLQEVDQDVDIQPQPINRVAALGKRACTHIRENIPGTHVKTFGEAIALAMAHGWLVVTPEMVTDMIAERVAAYNDGDPEGLGPVALMSIEQITDGAVARRRQIADGETATDIVFSVLPHDMDPPVPERLTQAWAGVLEIINIHSPSTL